MPNGECKTELRGHDNVIECIAWAPESAGVNISETVVNGGTEVQTRSGPYLVSGARDKTIRMWDTTNGLCLFILVNDLLEFIDYKKPKMFYFRPVMTIGFVVFFFIQVENIY